MAPSMPLERIRLFGWKDHKAAIWWLWLLYRRPAEVKRALQEVPRARAIRQGFVLYAHSLPYLFLSSVALRAEILSLRSTPWTWELMVGNVVAGIAVGIAFGIAFGNAFGIVAGIALGIAFGIAFGTAFGIVAGIFAGIAAGIVGGIAFGIAAGSAGVIAGVIADVIADVIAGVIAGGIAVVIAGVIVFGILDGISVGIAGVIVGGIAAGIASLRVYYLLVHPFFLWPRLRGRAYPLHPVAWDDLCSLPFPGLSRLLVAYAEVNLEGAQAEIERLITSYPSQRAEALRARVTLLARESARIASLRELASVAARMPHGAEVLLEQSRQVGEALHEIAKEQIRFGANSRPVVREALAVSLLRQIESVRYRISGFRQPLAREFGIAALAWEKLARSQRIESQNLVARKSISQVFRAGDPVDRESEAFLYRDSVVGALDQQVTLGAGCPGIVLYGRRRMGKSTLLTNLKGFLPSEVGVRYIDMLGPTASTSLHDFIGRISEESASDLPGLARYLDNLNRGLGVEGRHLLLAFDEYEKIDNKIGEGVFPLDLLDAIRESMQRHRRIVWLFAGSHEIVELGHAPWTSYLISARTLTIPFFTLDETRLLLTDPLRNSPLFQASDDRPRYLPAVWGDSGIERIHTEAGGWPHLVQLIAETVVQRLNEFNLPQVTGDMLEKSLDVAVVSGQNVLYELVRKECSLPGEWEYLSAFRRVEEQEEPVDEAIRQSLLRRELIEIVGGLWRLRVPLMARWLRYSLRG